MPDPDTASYLIKSRYPQVDARYATADPNLVCISAVAQFELLIRLKNLDPVHRLHFSVRQFLLSTKVLA